MGEVSKKIKRIEACYTPHNAPVMINYGIVTNNGEKSEAFALYFSQVYKNNNPITREQRGVYERGLEEAKRDNSEEYYMEITMREIMQVIDKLKGNSPRIDDIHNR